MRVTHHQFCALVVFAAIALAELDSILDGASLLQTHGLIGDDPTMSTEDEAEISQGNPDTNEVVSQLLFASGRAARTPSASNSTATPPPSPACVDGDVRITDVDFPGAEQKLYPEVLYHGEWYPICGHGFWGSNGGAEIVCQMLGFTTGRSLKKWTAFSKDAMPVGKCNPGEQLNACQGGFNAWGDFEHKNGKCKAGTRVGVQVVCGGGAFWGYCRGGSVPIHSERIPSPSPTPACVDGDVRITGVDVPRAGQFLDPEVLFGGGWYPICGHGFWGSTGGAEIVCQMLGFTTGTFVKKWKAFSKDSMPVGRCNPGERLTACTGGFNAWGDFEHASGKCKAGSNSGVQVVCGGGAFWGYCQGRFAPAPSPSPTGACVEGDVRITGVDVPQAGQSLWPEVYFGGEWYPICGHGFWGSSGGAEIVCQMLGFTTGTHAKKWRAFSKDAMPVGKCNPGERLTACTGGFNAWGDFEHANGKCKAGSRIGVQVICTGGDFSGYCPGRSTLTPPTTSPSASPTESPTMSPTEMPTESPTRFPTESPTALPTASPTVSPTRMPAEPPTVFPTVSPTVSPTGSPTALPTGSPTVSPTESPTRMPTDPPTEHPTGSPTALPTASPTALPTVSPTVSPTRMPTESPTRFPTVSPTRMPTASPTESPTVSPTTMPTVSPTVSPTGSPTALPTGSPTGSPTESPTKMPTEPPTEHPTGSPTALPTALPTVSPTASPTRMPTESPTESPTTSPTASATVSPSESPTMSPTTLPTGSPTLSPTQSPTLLPTESPTESPTKSPTKSPTRLVTESPTVSPTTDPTKSPTELRTESHTESSGKKSRGGLDPIAQHEGSEGSEGPEAGVTPWQSLLWGASLQENNLGGVGPEASSRKYMHFRGIKSDATTDMFVTNSTPYRPWNASVNGFVETNGSLAQVSLSCGESVALRFSFVDSQTGEPKRLTSFDFTVVDLDRGAAGRCIESIEVADYTAVWLPPFGSVQEVVDEEIGITRFIATDGDSNEENPSGLDGMSDAHTSKSVTFSFTNTQSFTMTLYTNTGVNTSSRDPDVVGWAGRRFLFG